MKFLIIQTAFIGDVILATPVVEKLALLYKKVEIDFVCRKGNEKLLDNNPNIRRVIIWDKRKNKYKNLFQLIKEIRQEKYNYIINLQRFASTGFITFCAKSENKIGFDKNPFSFCFTEKVSHNIGDGTHEVDRNLYLLKSLGDTEFVKPKLHPSIEDKNKINKYIDKPFICIAPGSVWYTKQYPKKQWIALIDKLTSYNMYLLGGPDEYDLNQQIIDKTQHNNIQNLAGSLSFLQSAALMQDAKMNYVNDSAPLHIASAVDAPVTAVFCSTVPGFGFGPLSDKSRVVEIEYELSCRPCSLHGKKVCPENHFKCALDIKTEQLLFE